MLVEKKVDYSRPRNLMLTAVVLVAGLSGMHVEIGSVSLAGMALAAVVALALGGLLFVLDRLKFTSD